MASISNLFLPSGTNLRVFYNKDTDRNKLMADLIEMWVPYCEENWLSQNHEALDCPENKVKKLLDSAAYFILYGNVEDTITLYKQKRNREHEVPLMINNTGEMFYEERGGGKPEKLPKKHITTRRTKIAMIKQRYPGIALEDVMVAVDGSFEYDGEFYWIDHSVAAYRPQWVKGEEFYECDRVIVGKTEKGLLFFSQSLDPLDGMIHKYETKAA